MNRELTYQIPTEFHMKKISEFLHSLGYSRQLLTTMRHTPDCIFYGDQSVHMNHLLDCTDKALKVIIPETETASDIIPVPMGRFANAPEILFEDEDIMVINKPANMPIHPSMSNPENSLANAIASIYEERGDLFVFRCVNRLDKDTSGLTVLAKNPLSAAILYEDVKSRRLSRTYYAFVLTKTDSTAPYATELSSSGTINLPISREEATDITHSIRRFVDEEHGAHAITHYSLIRQTDDLSLVELQLETGRTHQIRVHMSAIGHPLLGDSIYNPAADLRISRHALHAGRLEFVHPITKEKLAFETQMPADMLSLSST